MNRGFIFHFSLFFPTSFLLLGQKISLGWYFTWCLFYYSRDISSATVSSWCCNFKWLIYNSPDVPSTCSLWQGSCQWGFFSPAITFIIRPSTCPCRRITQWKFVTAVGSAACAGQRELQPAFVPGHSPVKLLVTSQVYPWGNLPDDHKHSPAMSNSFFQENRELPEHTRQKLFVPLQMLSFCFPNVWTPWLGSGTSLQPPINCLSSGAWSAPFPCTKLRCHFHTEPIWHF